MTANLCSSLKRARRSAGLRDFDRLPPELRRWLHGAALPWSARSVARVWSRALKEARGDAQHALAELTRLEREHLRRDAARIWGPHHPMALNPAGDR
ncbi:MAG: DUF6525 family protein [Rubricella sp.]